MKTIITILAFITTLVSYGQTRDDISQSQEFLDSKVYSDDELADLNQSAAKESLLPEINAENLNTYNNLAASIANPSRAFDPFGSSIRSRLGLRSPSEIDVSLNPDGTPITDDSGMAGVVSDPFQDALSSMRIWGYNLARQEILVGSDNIFFGDTILFSYNGQVMQATLHEMNNNSVIFRSPETGSMAEVTLPAIGSSTGTFSRGGNSVR